MKNTRSQQFGQLRARIEATFSGPTVLVVSSAARGDGKTVTAFGLAKSLAQADHRVLFVDTNIEAPVLARIHNVSVSSAFNAAEVGRYAVPVMGERFAGISFADQRFETGMSMEALKIAIANMRNSFDFIIVDTAPLIRSDLAVLFATVADGTLLTLRFGRLPSAADEETMKTLGRVGASVLGLLTVDPAMIKTFVSGRENVVPTVRVPARHVTSRHVFPQEASRTVFEAREGDIADSKIMK